MKQVFKQMLVLAAAACCLGCEKDLPDLSAEDCVAHIAFSAETFAEVVSRATVDLKDIPNSGVQGLDAGDLSLFLSAKDVKELKVNDSGEGDKVIETGTEFNVAEEYIPFSTYDDPPLYPAVYTAEFFYGTPDAVGRKKPYFYGKNQCEITRSHIGKKVNCKVSVTLQNALLRVTVDDNFKNYFTEPSFNVVLNDEPTEEWLTPTGTNSAPVYVPADSRVALKGTVRRPSQTTTDDKDGELMEVEVPARVIQKGTLYTFKFTAEAGGLQVTVVFDPFEEGDTSGHDPEMNDDAKDDAKVDE